MGPGMLTLLEWANVTVDDMAIQDVIDHWRQRNRTACKLHNNLVTLLNLFISNRGSICLSGIFLFCDKGGTVRASVLYGDISDYNKIGISD